MSFYHKYPFSTVISRLFSLEKHDSGLLTIVHLFNKRFPLTIAIAFLTIIITSCEKVLDVNLDKVEKRYVIEANLSDQSGSAKVLLTQTKDFDENNTFNGISAAQVTITESGGNAVPLIETAPGVYEHPTLKGVPGRNYQLSVAVNGQLFTAMAGMPLKVSFDSLFITDRTFFGEKNRYATVVYTDPAGIKNAYRFIQYVNGKREETNFIRDDDSNDGLKIERTLLYFYDEEEEEERKLKTGDQVRVEMLGIDYQVYKFWYSLSQSATGESDSATPGNPVTNIKGGALGYFSAHTLQSKTVVVP